jgi:crotonobetainyl-CoA:carnitine CoA-transferase CaiB-like acyl-CoA transferase
MYKRAENREELIRILDKAFATRTRSEWEKRLKENNCIYDRVQSSTEVVQDPQALANNFFTSIHHPDAGDMQLLNTPVKFEQNPASIR